MLYNKHSKNKVYHNYLNPIEPQKNSLKVTKMRQQYESLLCDKFGTEHANAVTSGEIALRISLEAVGAVTGNEVILAVTSPIKQASILLKMGLIPILTDVSDANSICSTDYIESLITPKTAAILSIPRWGYPGTTVELEEYAQKRGLPLVCDISDAVGVKHGSRYEGNYGSICCFDTSENSMINIGSGGIILTNDDEIQNKVLFKLNKNNDFDLKLSEEASQRGIVNLKGLESKIEAYHRHAWNWNNKLVKSADCMEQVWYKGSVKNNYQTVLYHLKEDIANEVSAYKLTELLGNKGIIHGYSQNKIDLLSCNKEIYSLQNNKSQKIGFPNGTYVKERLFPLRVDSTFDDKTMTAFADFVFTSLPKPT